MSLAGSCDVGGACPTACDAPPTVIVPLRLLVPAFAVNEKFAVPLPVPLLLLVSQLVELLTAVQGIKVQPLAQVTVKLLVPLELLTLLDVGLSVGEPHELCVTVYVLPAMVKVPLRSAPVLAAACQLTVPLPLPLLPDVIVSQLESLEAVHGQSVPIVTLTLLLPPAGSAISFVEDKADVQVDVAVKFFPVTLALLTLTD